ncbi:MAG: DUF2469 family protein [Acidimicrobiales bacterium]
MSAEELESHEAELRLQLYREYRDVASMFRYVVETERGVYLANSVTSAVEGVESRPFVTLELRDAWVWDMYRQQRFVPHVRIVTFRDVSIEELNPGELAVPEAGLVHGDRDHRDGEPS